MYWWVNLAWDDIYEWALVGIIILLLGVVVELSPLGHFHDTNRVGVRSLACAGPAVSHFPCDMSLPRGTSVHS